MEQKIVVKEMIKKINSAIDEFNEDYKECNSMAMIDAKMIAKSRIKGMVDMLETVTGVNYKSEVFFEGKVYKIKTVFVGKEVKNEKKCRFVYEANDRDFGECFLLQFRTKEYGSWVSVADYKVENGKVNKKALKRLNKLIEQGFEYTGVLYTH